MKWVGTIISVLLGLLFLFAGGTKLAGLPMHMEHFAGWGYPSWFVYVAGFIEAASAVLILIPKTRLYGAILVICTILGAIATLARAGDTAQLPVPVVVLVLAVFTAMKNRPGH